jgi:hypothetical protein
MPRGGEGVRQDYSEGEVKFVLRFLKSPLGRIPFSLGFIQFNAGISFFGEKEKNEKQKKQREINLDPDPQGPQDRLETPGFEIDAGERDEA